MKPTTIRSAPVEWYDEYTDKAPAPAQPIRGNSNKGLSLEAELAEAARREAQSRRDRIACALSKARRQGRRAAAIATEGGGSNRDGAFTGDDGGRSAPLFRGRG